MRVGDPEVRAWRVTLAVLDSCAVRRLAMLA
jgi:hypothetical protein